MDKFLTDVLIILDAGAFGKQTWAPVGASMKSGFDKVKQKDTWVGEKGLFGTDIDLSIMRNYSDDFLQACLEKKHGLAKQVCSEATIVPKRRH